VAPPRQRAFLTLQQISNALLAAIEEEFSYAGLPSIGVARPGTVAGRPVRFGDSCNFRLPPAPFYVRSFDPVPEPPLYMPCRAATATFMDSLGVDLDCSAMEMPFAAFEECVIKTAAIQMAHVLSDRAYHYARDARTPRSRVVMATLEREVPAGVDGAVATSDNAGLSTVVLSAPKRPDILRFEMYIGFGTRPA
jgi:hypothetical protein